MSDSGVHSHSVSGSDSSIYLPASIIVAALIVSASVFFVGADISRQVSGLSSALAGTQNAVPSPGTDSGNTGGNAGNSGSPNVPNVSLDQVAETGISVGDNDAKVTIVEFSDFSCPFCAAASGANEQLAKTMKQNNPNYQPAVSNIIKDYVDTGKARMVFKYFPGHGSGQQAQLVAWCLYDQKPDAFLKFHDGVFADYTNANDLGKMKAIAVSAGANSATLDSCISSKKYDSRLEQETNEGSAVGVTGTPTFFINGKAIVGARPYADFKSVIDAALAG